MLPFAGKRGAFLQRHRLRRVARRLLAPVALQLLSPRRWLAHDEDEEDDDDHHDHHDHRRAGGCNLKSPASQQVMRDESVAMKNQRRNIVHCKSFALMRASCWAQI